MATVLESSPSVIDGLTPRLQPVQRNIAVDVYRGFVMLLMMAEVLRFARAWARVLGG